MKHLIPQEYRRPALAAIVVIAVGVLFVGIMIYYDRLFSALSSILGALSPFMVGGALAFIQMPIARKAEDLLRRSLFKKRPKSRAPRVISVIFSILILLGAIAAFMWVLLPQLISSVESLVRQITNFVNNNHETVNDFLKKAGLLDAETDPLNSTWQNILSVATNYIGVAADILRKSGTMIYQFFFQMFVGIVTSIYLLMQRDLLARQAKKVCYALMKKENAETLIYWSRKANRIFGGFTTGKIIDSAVIGVICYIGMLIMRLEYPLLISVIIGVTNILPFFGPFIGAIPSILILLIVRPASALAFGIFIVILQQVDGNVIGPKILGDYTGISGLWTMVAIILGSSLFGFVGMLISVPTFALLYAIARTVLEKRLKKRGLPIESAAYEKPEETLKDG